MSRVVALARMRCGAYARSQRAYPPAVAALVAVLMAHTGGPSRPDLTFAFSAALLFGVFAWQTKLVLDAEPDTQRLLSRVAVGSGRREQVAGLLAAGVAAVPLVAVAVVMPLFAGVLGAPTRHLLPWLPFGLWIHVLAAVAGVGVGALASRVVAGARGRSATTLLGGFVLVLVLGSRDTIAVRWLVPQLLGADGTGGVGMVGLITVHTLLWTGLVLAVYVGLRRTRP
ncbi:MAG TPA: hypothetical protein VI076_07450 [Actinopolymorphaceae bacterium]